MSAQSNEAAYSQFATANYVDIAATGKYILGFPSLRCSHSICPAALVIYELLITIDGEARIIWKRPITAPAVLLGSVRCCSPLQILNWVLDLIGFVQTALFSALRVFAIWDRSYAWSLVVFALSMVPFATNLVYTTPAPNPAYALVDTPMQYNAVNSSYGSVVYITRSLLILNDAIVLVLTWIKTFGHWRSARRVNVKASLTACLLRDGTVYFITLLSLSIAQLLTYDASANSTLVGKFIETLPPVLINRFMINLRAVDSEMSGDSVDMSDSQQGQSTPRFIKPTDRLGNLGETLHDGWSDKLWDDKYDTSGMDEERDCETAAEA
ncbi:uncharacterized protein PHACADRAFT_201098 [Phanerochaete carnosa HHB-10118-sp]|uniref:DUF6533 domain-containing protein n=1 Tax=Phanerochaete carnosa (strain HHB-10118-sp) TaxID=650164 RepID=K5UKT2_PHACS|nr:uncharacterized protein PHACADRAFT_201098 [Phanerochaete carnosa HHB-10118-sp]EKM50256.1 hypothetical protein PHACADRAFT_201098 [Phanerochaete carnosa HHB-10118-sp]